MAIEQKDLLLQQVQSTCPSADVLQEASELLAREYVGNWLNRNRQAIAISKTYLRTLQSQGEKFSDDDNEFFSQLITSQSNGEIDPNNLYHLSLFETDGTKLVRHHSGEVFRIGLDSSPIGVKGTYFRSEGFMLPIDILDLDSGSSQTQDGIAVRPNRDFFDDMDQEQRYFFTRNVGALLRLDNWHHPDYKKDREEGSEGMVLLRQSEERDIRLGAFSITAFVGCIDGVQDHTIEKLILSGAAALKIKGRRDLLQRILLEGAPALQL